MPREERHELESLRSPTAMEEEESEIGPVRGETTWRSHRPSRESQSWGETSMLSPNDVLDRRVRRKLDWILLPFLAILFLLNSLDKSNVGNAETAGFTRDAGLSAGDLNTSMAFFFAFFVALQPVGAALGRKYGMARWVPACMSLWGLCTLMHMFVRRRWQLICLRIAVASLEAGFYPTTVSYLSLFYTRFEFAVRLGFFYGQTAVAGVLGGILSWAVFSRFEKTPSGPSVPPLQAHSDENENGWKAWEVLFLIEGCMTIGVALIGFFWLPHSADTAWFMNAQERRWAEQRIRLDRDQTANASARRASVRSAELNDGSWEQRESDTLSQTKDDEDDEQGEESHHRLLRDTSPLRRRISTTSALSMTADSGLTRHEILSALLSTKIWHLLICNILSAIPATAFTVFLPLVVKQLSPALNLTPSASNLLSAPPFAFGACILFIFTRWSDASRQRLVPIFWGLGLLLVGLTATVMVPQSAYVWRYISLCVLLSGSFIASPLTVAWLADNTPKPGKRAILLGINGWGNLAGVFSSLLFTPGDSDSGYTGPFAVTLVCVAAAFAGFIAFWVVVVRENKWRDDLLAAWTDEDVQQEDVSGDVFIPLTNSGRLGRALGIHKLVKRFGGWDERRGDEKMTFRYGL